jgi:hypothetical protein
MRHVLQVSPRFPAAPLALALAAVLGLAAVPASAGPVGVQASYGWYTQEDDSFIGLGARLGAASITVIPSIEWLFADHGSIYTLNLDATMTVLPLGVATGYAGAGIGMLTVDPDHGDSKSDMTVNLIAGAGLNAIPLKPFAQLKYVVVDGDDPVAFSIGARF